MEEEIWKDVIGFEGHYQVSNLGRVKNIFFRGKPRNQIIKGHRNKVSLGVKRNRKNYYIDLLVAQAFLPKAEIMEVVDHINGDESDNRADNLKWSNITWVEKISIIKKHNATLGENEWHKEDGIVYFKIANDGQYGMCDEQTWENLRKYRWRITPSGYIASHVEGHYTKFHNMVLQKKEGYYADHINRNRLDNRRCNLRYASYHANAINHSLSKRNKSGICGVRKFKNGKYQAYIWFGKQIHLGLFDTIEQAQEARMLAEEKYHKPIIEKETHI